MKISENKNENVEIIVKDTDEIRKQILEKIALGRKNQESSTILYFYTTRTSF